MYSTVCPLHAHAETNDLKHTHWSYLICFFNLYGLEGSLVLRHFHVVGLILDIRCCFSSPVPSPVMTHLLLTAIKVVSCASLQHQLSHTSSADYKRHKTA